MLPNKKIQDTGWVNRISFVDGISLTNNWIKKIMKVFNKLILCHGKPKFKLTYSHYFPGCKVLDIGIDNNSYRETKLVYNKCIYYGLDNKSQDIKYFSKNDKFILANLEEPKFTSNINTKFNIIIANHVLEHVRNGYQSYVDLIGLLEVGGVMYCEFPNIKTLYLKKNFYRYHFHDDKTHVSLYELSSLANIAMNLNCTIISCGPISTFVKSLLSIPRFIISILKLRPSTSFLLHFSGSISHILIQKNE